MQQEVWREIEGYEGLYHVSDLGRVRDASKTPPRILNQPTNTLGYSKVSLLKDGKYRQHSVHRLVGNAFIPNPLNKPQINHKDGNKTNNTLSNLEWCTAQENSLHWVRTLRRTKTTKQTKVKDYPHYRVPPEVDKLITKLANRENRSKSKQLVHMVSDYAEMTEARTITFHLKIAGVYHHMIVQYNQSPDLSQAMANVFIDGLQPEALADFKVWNEIINPLTITNL